MMTIEVIKSENNNRDNDGEVPKIHAENHWSSLMMGFDAVNMMTFPVLPRGKRGVFDQTYIWKMWIHAIWLTVFETHQTVYDNRFSTKAQQPFQFVNFHFCRFCVFSHFFWSLFLCCHSLCYSRVIWVQVYFKLPATEQLCVSVCAHVFF